MSFFDDLSPLGKILCGAALVAAAPVAAAAAIPVCIDYLRDHIAQMAEAVKDVRE